MLKKIEGLAERVVEYLGIEMVPTQFDDTIADDSRLITRPTIKIIINGKYRDDYLECAKAITHEMRHLFQMLWARLMNDAVARRWKEAFKVNLQEYFLQSYKNVIL